jgi:nitrile hydratase subunit alpha
MPDLRLVRPGRQHPLLGLVDEGDAGARPTPVADPGAELASGSLLAGPPAVRDGPAVGGQGEVVALVVHALRMADGPPAPRIERVNDLPPDVHRLRVIETYLQLQLDQVREALRQAEKREADERRARQRAYAEQHWKLQPRRGTRECVLHRGGCGQWKRQMGYLDREEVLLALEDEAIAVEMCQVCRPETGLQT